MGTHRPPVVMPDMKRRRASTGERIATIMTLARRLPLTRQVLADQLADATPSQMEFMESWMNAEIESRCVLASWRPLCERCFSAV